MTDTDKSVERPDLVQAPCLSDLELRDDDADAILKLGFDGLVVHDQEYLTLNLVQAARRIVSLRARLAEAEARMEELESYQIHTSIGTITVTHQFLASPATDGEG